MNTKSTFLITWHMCFKQNFPIFILFLWALLNGLEINAEYKQKYIWNDGNVAWLVVMNGDFYVLESLIDLKNS